MKDWRIVSLPSGHVLVGVWHQDGHRCHLTEAAVIRRWGTTKGLGQLFDGPLSSTVLDPCNGISRFNEFNVIFSIDLNPEPWEKWSRETLKQPEQTVLA